MSAGRQACFAAGIRASLSAATLTVALALFLLPRMKGMFVALQWAKRMHGFGAAPDPAHD